jgi:hypothetical protein
MKEKQNDLYMLQVVVTVDDGSQMCTINEALVPKVKREMSDVY